MTINYTGVVSRWIEPWLKMDRTLLGFIVFWVLFLTCALTVRYVISRIAQIMKWERIHWLLQGLGLALGTIRGLWWAGFVALALASSGLTYLEESIEQRALLGPSILAAAQPAFEEVSDLFPGAQHRGQPLLPPARVVPSTS